MADSVVRGAPGGDVAPVASLPGGRHDAAHRGRGLRVEGGGDHRRGAGGRQVNKCPKILNSELTCLLF